MSALALCLARPRWPAFGLGQSVRTRTLPPPNGLKMPFWALVGKDLAKLPKYDLLLGFNPPGRGGCPDGQGAGGWLRFEPCPPPRNCHLAVRSVTETVTTSHRPPPPVDYPKRRIRSRGWYLFGWNMGENQGDKGSNPVEKKQHFAPKRQNFTLGVRCISRRMRMQNLHHLTRSSIRWFFNINIFVILVTKLDRKNGQREL